MPAKTTTSANAAFEADAAAGGRPEKSAKGAEASSSSSPRSSIISSSNNNNKMIPTTRTTTTTTKRQRRKQPNNKHLWPQHPNIRDPKARAKAYIRTAGLVVASTKNDDDLTTRTTQQQQPSSSLDPALDLHSPQVKFGRLLGGTDQRVRHKALLQLQAYLKARCSTTINPESSTSSTTSTTSGLSELDLLKLWKGLWYTLYMADKTVVQEEVSRKIAELIWCVAGTEEEDEYAGQAYLALFGDDDDDDDDDDADGGGVMEEEEEDDDADGGGVMEEEDEDDDAEEDDDEDEDVTMEEVLNTLGENDDSEEEEDESSSEGDDDDDDEESSNSSSEGSGEGNGDEKQGHDNDDRDDHDNEEDINDSEKLHCRGAHLASLFVRTFFLTVRREWGKMDKYRVDKFYTLMRFMMQEIYRYMAIRHWNMGIIRLFNDAIFEEILCQTPNGLRFHLIDICLDELAKVNAKAPMPLTEATFFDVLEPFFGMVQTGAGDPLVQARVMENVLEKFLNEYSVVSENALALKNDSSDDSDESSDDDEDELPKRRLIMDQVHVGTVAQFIFQVASDGATHNSYRRNLYELHKTYMRRIKQAGRDVTLDEEDHEEDAVIDKVEVDTEQQLEEEIKENENHDADKAEAIVPVNEDSIEPVQSTRIKKKNNNRKKASSDSNVHDADSKDNIVGAKEGFRKIESDQVLPKDNEESKEPNTEDTDPTKKRKRRKKRKKQDAVEQNEKEEEEITITLEDQANAKKVLLHNETNAVLDQKTPVDKKRKQTNDLTSSEKRVKFGNTNRSRSWTASMKGLRTMETPIKKDAAPERSILLNKHVKPKVAKVQGKKKKRRAVDYF